MTKGSPGLEHVLHLNDVFLPHIRGSLATYSALCLKSLPRKFFVCCGSPFLMKLPSLRDLTGFKFRSHGTKGRQIPRVSVSSTIYVLYDFFTWKSEKNILLENFTNYYVILLIHLIRKSSEPAKKKIQRFPHSYLTVLNDGLLACRSGNIVSHDFSNLEDFSTSILLILPLSYGNPSFVKLRNKLGFRSYLCTK